MRSRSAKTGLWLILAVFLIASAAAMNIYLMEHRPVVARNDQDDRQLCGRVNGPIYCVRITDRDAMIYGALVTSSAIVGIPAILYIVFSSRWRDRL